MRKVGAVARGIVVFLLLVASASLPSQAPTPATASVGGGSSVNVFVTNADFAKFEPGLQYDPKEAGAPAMVKRLQAQDYVGWLGKILGKDFMWVPTPGRTDGRGAIVAILGDPPADMAPQTPDESERPRNMVYVPSGGFIMGSDVGDTDESPKHQATTVSFLIDKYEVSNAEFREVFPEFQFEPGRENHAAVVTWEQANAYAAKVGKRLPTEAEWEKAARGTDGRTFPWGEIYDPSFVNWDDTYPRGGSAARAESPYGCIDMAGGVWEWTDEWYKPYPGNNESKEQYGEMYRVIRGGGSYNDVALMRTTQRYYLPPNTTGKLRVGFRCVKTVE